MGFDEIAAIRELPLPADLSRLVNEHLAAMTIQSAYRGVVGRRAVQLHERRRFLQEYMLNSMFKVCVACPLQTVCV